MLHRAYSSITSLFRYLYGLCAKVLGFSPLNHERSVQQPSEGSLRQLSEEVLEGAEACNSSHSVVEVTYQVVYEPASGQESASDASTTVVDNLAPALQTASADENVTQCGATQSV